MTLYPYAVDNLENTAEIARSSILHVKPLPLNWSFSDVYEEFSKFGLVKEIRNRLGKNHAFFETWIIFEKGVDALRASKEFVLETTSVHCSLVDSFPANLDTYRHLSQIEELQQESQILRSLDPPRWLIATTHGDRGNLFKVKQYVSQKLGHIKKT